MNLLDLCVFLLGVSLVACQQTEEVSDLALDDEKNAHEANFISWLGTSGVQVGGIDIANFTNPIFTNYKLRGVKAKSDIKAGDELLSVPGSLIISTVTALSSPMAAVFRENPQLFADDQVLLTIFVMYELQNIENSKWREHLKTMPTRFHTACEYTASELRQLEGSVLYDEAEARQALFLNEYQALFPFLPQHYPHFFDAGKSTFTAYKYARLLVQTRGFGMHVDGRVIVGIVPLGDMMNHSPHAKIAWKYDHAANVFRMYSEAPYTQGQQVYNNYGPRSNRRLLLDFGFVIQDNPFDFVELPAPISTGNSLAKQHVLEDRGIDPAKRSYSVRLGEVPDELMFAARIARATVEEVDDYQRANQLAQHDKVAPHFNTSLSVRNEIAALSWLQDTAATMLKKYRETYEDDVVLLDQASALDKQQLNSLILRHSEKRIYTFLKDFANVHVTLLDYYQQYAVGQNGNKGNSLTNARVALAAAEYMRNVLLPLQRALLEKAYNDKENAVAGSSQGNALIPE